jgi:hypothetical protein
MNQRFSQLYLERGTPARDSARFRHRLSAFFSDQLSREFNYPCRVAYERETGVAVPWLGNSWHFNLVFKQAELRDVLDAITITHQVLVKGSQRRLAAEWLNFVKRAMLEENVGYQLDDQCIVHFHIDEEFERVRATTLAVLDYPEFGAVKAAFEDAYRHLDSEAKDTKASARSMFEALEILSKLMVPTANRLVKNLCVQKLREVCLSVSGGDITEQQVLSEMFTSLGHWVEANHDYRHGQRAHERVAPSEETAVFILSTGSAFLRQLAIYATRMQLAAPPTSPVIYPSTTKED